MRHETLRLNSNMLYVLVNDTWYDTHADLNPKIGQNFLNGVLKRSSISKLIQKGFLKLKMRSILLSLKRLSTEVLFEE